MNTILQSFEFELILIAISVLSSFGIVCSIFKIFRTKSSQDFNIGTICFFAFNVGLLLVYDLIKVDMLLISCNIIVFIMCLSWIVMFIKYKNNKETIPVF